MSTKETLVVNDHIFEIVDEVPLGYKIWNIGRNMPDGYLPFVRVRPDLSVEVETMKAIKIDGAQTILAAIGGGEDTIEKMEEFLNHHQNTQPPTPDDSVLDAYDYAQIERIKAALPIMRQLKWPGRRD